MNSLSQQKYSLPDPRDITGFERGEAVNSYLMMLAAWVFGLPLPLVGLIAAVIYYVLHKNKSSFVGFHSLQALTALIPVAVVNAGVIFWLLFLFLNGFENLNSFLVFVALSVIINLAFVAFTIIAAVKASKGLYYFFFLPPSLARIRFSDTEIPVKEGKIEIDFPEEDEYRMS